MKIGLDVMGGDYAPDVTIEGAIMALDKIAPTDRIFLFGPKETCSISAGIPNANSAGIESPSLKPDTSIIMGDSFFYELQL